MGDPAFCTRGRYSVLLITGAGQAVRRFAFGRRLRCSEPEVYPLVTSARSRG
jgi:hypothetical protein